MGKDEKFNKVKYDNQYIKENLDIVKFSVPKGEKEQIKSYAAKCGESISAFLRRAIRLIRWVDSHPSEIPPTDEQIKKEIEPTAEPQKGQTKDDGIPERKTITNLEELMRIQQSRSQTEQDGEEKLIMPWEEE